MFNKYIDIETNLPTQLHSKLLHTSFHCFQHLQYGTMKMVFSSMYFFFTRVFFLQFVSLTASQFTVVRHIRLNISRNSPSLSARSIDITLHVPRSTFHAPLPLSRMENILDFRPTSEKSTFLVENRFFQ